MKIGFTGTRRGMTQLQEREFRRLITVMAPTHFYHGGAIGSDVRAAMIVREIRRSYCQIECFPARKNYTPLQDEVVHPVTLDPIARNPYIIAASEFLIATPYEEQEILRSGTWATIRLARNALMNHTIIGPRGLLTAVEYE